MNFPKQNEESIEDENKEKAVRQLIENLHLSLREMFRKHHSRVESQNQQKNYGGKHSKNEISDKFYNSLAHLEYKLREGVISSLKEGEKLREQRRQYFLKKMGRFAEVLKELNSKKSIRIKMTEHLEKLVAQASQDIDQATSNIKGFNKESAMWCGKNKDYKILVETSLTQCCQHAYLFEQLSRFQSITNDSVKQVYLPVQYDQNDFRGLKDLISSLWPKTLVRTKEVAIPVKEKEKEDSHIQEAHQLYFGFGRPQQPLEAIKIYQQQYKKAKGSAKASALNALGIVYESGKHVKKDLKKAFKYFRQSAQLGNAQGLYKVGYFLEKGLVNSKEEFSGQFSNRQAEILGGIDYYEKAAKLNHLDALTDLGYIYENGIRDQFGNWILESFPTNAVAYYKIAKKEDFPRALNNLGSFLIRNSGFNSERPEDNIAAGIKYLTRAKDLKYPKAFLNLGKCYETGIGVKESLDMARAIYLEGIETGQNTCRLEYIKSYLNENIEDDKIMIKLCEICKGVLLQDSSNPEANYFMGIFYEKGIGTEKNPENSLYYVEKAARRNYSPALVKLGDYYYSGFAVDKNIQFARKLYTQAWDLGNTQGLVNLGVLKQKGIGDQEKDLEAAYRLYEEAARLGNANAVLLLGLKRNPEQETETLIKAAGMGNVGAANLLNKTQAKLLPKKEQSTVTYEEVMRQRTTLYCKDNEGRSTIRSSSRSKREGL